jgi:hypothetical protein
MLVWSQMAKKINKKPSSFFSKVGVLTTLGAKLNLISFEHFGHSTNPFFCGTLSGWPQ